MHIQLISLLLSLICLSVLASHHSSSESHEHGNNPNKTIVKTKYGKLRGFKYETPTGFDAKIFLNIPYAKPPIGELRFEKTVPPNPWAGVRDATKWGIACAPSVFGGNISLNSEDCLTLNIMAPAQKKKNGYPVLIWIHGGGNKVDNAKNFGYMNMTNNFVSQGIIVVSIQYRLSVFGFASTGDDAMPGNYGLWDMVQATKFIKKVIRDFGGNPKRIVLWGLSSSAEVVSAFALTPKAYPHFDASVIQSGSAWSALTVNNEGIAPTFQLAALLNCTAATSAGKKACMKSKTFEEIWEALKGVGITRYGSISPNLFQPRVDGDFFPHNITEMIKTAPPKPAYIGGGDAEGALYAVFGALKKPNRTPWVLWADDWTTFNEANFTQFVHTHVVQESFYGPLANQAAAEIIDFYSSDKTNTSDGPYWVRKYAQLIGDYVFAVPSLMETAERVKYGWPTYLYLNVHYSNYLYDKVSNNTPFRGSMHTNEYAYQWGYWSVGVQFPFDQADRDFQRNLRETIGNFVKYGNPSTPYLNWKKVTPQHPLQYAKINATPTFETTNLWEDRLNFWDNITNSGRYPFNLIFRVNYDNITTYACNIATNQIC